MRLIVVHFGQNQRQFFVGKQNVLAVFEMHYGQRFAPIALAGKYPFAQFIAYGFFAVAVLFKPFEHCGNRFLLVHTVHKPAVYV